ncbi:MAG: alpha/beta fold hydrolase [Rhodospirillaceae bacterium]
MRFWSYLGLLLLLLASIVVDAQAADIQARSPIDGPQIVEANGYAFNVVVKVGDPSLPTIFLESGGGHDSSQWKDLQPRIAAETGATVIAYDRPGFGKSPLPTRAYDIVAETDAIRAAVNSLGLGKRVLLVGHSYGGFIIQTWAARDPYAVIGLLFLDPNTPATMLAMGAEMTPRAKANPKTPRDFAFNRMDETGNAPFVAVYAQQIPVKIPLIVVSAEVPPFRDPRQIDVFRLSHELLAKSVTNGKHVVAAGANHNLHTQAPDVIVASVKELLTPR